MNPFHIAAALYSLAAVFMAATSALAELGVIGDVAGVAWLRIHLVTLGVVTHVVMGGVPALVGARPRWSVFALLNAGLALLIVGMPTLTPWLMSAGGALVGCAVLGCGGQLLIARRPDGDAPTGTPFYLTGLAFLLLGVLIGTGMFQPWLTHLHIGAPIEVHIHANGWGFAALVFAGLLVDVVPAITGEPFASARALLLARLGMAAGAFLLVLGPWLHSLPVTAPGLLLHLFASAWLWRTLVVRTRASAARNTPGLLHLWSGYLWMLAPVAIAPLVLLGVPGFAAGRIEENAPEALVYGWMLQLVFALGPLLARRALTPDAPMRLGGGWHSLVTVHAGAVLLWAGVFFPRAGAVLHSLAYVLWAFATVPLARELAVVVQQARDEARA